MVSSKIAKAYFKDTASQNAFLNACDCMYFGFGKVFWNDCDCDNPDNVWEKAKDYMSKE